MMDPKIELLMLGFLTLFVTELALGAEMEEPLIGRLGVCVTGKINTSSQEPYFGRKVVLAIYGDTTKNEVMSLEYTDPSDNFRGELMHAGGIYTHNFDPTIFVTGRSRNRQKSVTLQYLDHASWISFKGHVEVRNAFSLMRELEVECFFDQMM